MSSSAPAQVPDLNRRAKLRGLAFQGGIGIHGLGDQTLQLLGSDLLDRAAAGKLSDLDDGVKVNIHPLQKASVLRIDRVV